jgi:hypothetical protein
MTVVQQEDARGTGARLPYVAYPTFKNFFLKFDPVPLRVDRQLLSYTAGGTAGLLLHAFRSLELIHSDGSPAEEMVALGKAYLADLKDNEPLRRVLRRAYPTVFELDLTRATASQLSERLKEFGLNGDTIRKGAAFFLAAAEDAGIEYSKHLKVKRAPGARRAIPKPTNDRPSPKDAGTAFETGRSPGAVAPAYPPALVGILGLLPAKGSWDQATRDRFVATFTGVLDLCYSIKSD